MADLASYVRHAGAVRLDDVFETATAGLGTFDLGTLSLRLQNIDAKWKVPDQGGFAPAARRGRRGNRTCAGWRR